MYRCRMIFTMVFLASVVPGCSSVSVKHPHIVVDHEGRALSDQGQLLSESDFDKQINNIAKEIEHHVNREINLERIPKFMIYIHGGLNTREAGLDYINTMTDKNGYLKGTELYPIFINWDSSLFSSLADDLFTVRSGIRDPILGVVTSPFIIANRLVDSIVKAPVTLVNHWDTEKMQFEQWSGEQRTFTENALNGTLSLLSLPATITTLPFLGGFGEGSWQMMNRRIDQMFAVRINPLPRFYQNEDNRPGAVRLFLEKITARMQKIRAKHPETRISLVGHSMGTIIINHILREFPEVKFERIIYLGAAATIKDYRNTIPGYLSHNPSSQFYSFSLSIKDESGEFNYFLPRGSLLVWIENIFEPGLSPSDKRIGFFRNRHSNKIRSDKMETLCKRIHLVKYTGLSNEPRSHSDFNENGILQNILAMANSSKSLKDMCPSCITPSPCTSKKHNFNIKTHKK